jgi:hypothetical protein
MPPDINTRYFRQYLAPRLTEATRKALDQAPSPADWNATLFTSPEFMFR